MKNLLAYRAKMLRLPNIAAPYMPTFLARYFTEINMCHNLRGPLHLILDPWTISAMPCSMVGLLDRTGLGGGSLLLLREVLSLMLAGAMMIDGSRATAILRGHGIVAIFLIR